MQQEKNNRCRTGGSAARTSGLLLLLCCLPILAGGCASRTQAAGETTLSLETLAGDETRITAVLRGPAAAGLRRSLRGGSQEEVEKLFYLAVQPGPNEPPQVGAPLLARLEWRSKEPGGPEQAVLSPQASLTRGLTYVAVFDGPRLSSALPRLVETYTVPRDNRPSESEVTAVYPAQAELPANLLKFYVHFSRPMAQGRVFRHARLLDARDRPIDQAFHEVEYWSDDHTRLTLFINPGRTKHALGLSESLGPVLQPERDYTLEITPGLPDDRGRPLARALRHRFRTTGLDREQPAVSDWKIEAPRAGTRAPLSVRFAEPLDHALAARVIGVEHRRGEAVRGTAAVTEDGLRWSFTPDTAWESGNYVLAAAGELEDLAGNSLYRPFETTAGNGPRPSPEPPVFRREFAIGGAR